MLGEFQAREERIAFGFEVVDRTRRCKPTALQELCGGLCIQIASCQSAGSRSANAAYHGVSPWPSKLSSRRSILAMIRAFSASVRSRRSRAMSRMLALTLGLAARI